MESEFVPISAEGQAYPTASWVARRHSPRLGRLRRILRVFLIAASVAFGSMLALGVVSWIRSQAAVAVVQTQMDDIRGGKVEEAYALFSAEYQAGVTLPMFRRYLRHRNSLAKAGKVQFWGRSVWGETALLWGSFRDDLGHSVPVRYLLVREKGSWRIDGFHLAAEAPEREPDAVRFVQI
jgi:hypothetical protein